MPRRHTESYAWTFDNADNSAIANAHITLALMRCVRRLPGAFKQHNFDDLGAALAPALAPLAKRVRTTVLAHLRSRGSLEDSTGLVEDLGGGLLHNSDVQTLLGQALARAVPRFRSIFDDAEALLKNFIERHPLSAERNLSILVRLIDLPAPALALVRLAMAFSYSSVERSLFAFVASRSQIISALDVLCGVRGSAAVRLFDAHGPLGRSCLLHALGSRRSNFDLDDLLRLSSAGESLLGTPFEDENAMACAVLTPLAAPLEGARLEWPHLGQQRTLLKAALGAAVDGRVAGVNILLHGAPGTGKTQFVRQLVAEIGASGFIVEDADEHGAEASRAERLASLQLSQTFAGQRSRAVLVLDEAEDIFQGDHQHPMAGLCRSPGESKSWMNQMLENNPNPVVWISNRISHLDPAYLRRFAYCLEFPQTPVGVRRRIAHDRLAAIGCSESLIDTVGSIAELAPAHLDSAARFATLCRDSGLGADVAVRSMVNAQLRAAGHTAPLASAPRSTRFDLRYLNVAGAATPDRLLESLARIGPGAAATLLFSGPPGTGKTQFAAEIAECLGRRLVVRTASDIHSKWYGESEGNVASMFRDCDPQAEMLFLDEAEVLLGSREDSTHRADRAVTAEFLRWLEVFQGTFVCATNHAASFDAALMRRFTFRLEFLPLTLQQRLDLYGELSLGWRAVDGAGPPAVDRVSQAALAALEGLTPGDFANAARRIRALDLPAGAWIDELRAEHQAKVGPTAGRIGFL